MEVNILYVTPWELVKVSGSGLEFSLTLNPLRKGVIGVNIP